MSKEKKVRLGKEDYENAILLLQNMRGEYIFYFGDKKKEDKVFIKKLDTDIELIRDILGKRVKRKYKVDYKDCPEVFEAYCPYEISLKVANLIKINK